MANKKKSSRKSKGSSKAVDLITGKEKVEYFLDPSLLLPTETKAPRTPKRGGATNNAESVALQHPHLFSPCTIVKSSVSHMLTKTKDGSLYRIIPGTNLTKLTQEDRMGMEDVLNLPIISEQALLHTLRVRYHRDEIYTNAGPILISINPYKTILKHNTSIYSESNMMQYRKQVSSSKSSTPPPHLFSIADRAYNALQEKSINQSIIISGESGAGKTEATKIIMQYLAKSSSSSPSIPYDSEGGEVPQDQEKKLEEQVLASNPLLESFGNARTLRNDNSSRFGKFIQIKFQQGHIAGATIRNYLLEKTRIVQQIEGERNYHIFYQIFSDPALSEEFGLGDADAGGFHYLSKRCVKSKKDEQMFAETKDCLENIGLGNDAQKVIFQIVAGVLHLGNVQFQSKSEQAEITSESQSSLETACILLGLESENVSKAILTKILSIGGKSITKSQDVAQANDKRDALAKLVYSSLFLWLVSKVNQTIHHAHSSEDLLSSSSYDAVDTTDSMNSIGVLDIYGFEQFDTNGFEQLLINYANEKLQRHFNKHLFEVEQELYAMEGVDWTYITFNDNRPCLELIEGGSGSVGILGTLDDAWGGMASGNEKDIKFVNHLHQLFGGVQETSASVRKNKQNDGRHENFRMPKFTNDRDFIIIHYAGEVRYTANNFVEKNVESLSNELKSLGMTSSSALAKDIFTHCSDESPASLDTSSRARSSIRGVSVASQFKTSLQALVSDLEETEPHYIRCIKPNLKKASNSFHAGEVLRQLRCAGMMEAIRIRREGYALREPHEHFYDRFQLLLESEEITDDDGISNLVKVLSKRLHVTDVDWQLGHTKIFLRRELAAKLEKLTSLRIRSAARTLGRFGKFVSHRRALRLIVAWGRLRVFVMLKNRKIRAASKIQSIHRMVGPLTTFRILKEASIVIQACVRMIQAKDVLRKLKDPFEDMSFDEVEELFKKESNRLEKAIATKRYELAAELEAKITPIKEAMEEKRPLTRDVLDNMISEVEKELQEALGSKNYSACPPLQQRLDDLKIKLEDFPTIEELEEKINSAQQAVDDAAASRDFSGAAERQASVDEAKRRLNEALAANGSNPSNATDTDLEKEKVAPVDEEKRSFFSRAELEKNIDASKSDLSHAIAKKQFQEASTYQARLDELEAFRELFPTIDEIEGKIGSLKDEMADAIKKKDFSKAGQLQETIDEQEANLEKEKENQPEVAEEAAEGSETENTQTTCASIMLPDGTQLEFASRAGLEKEISKKEKAIQKAAASKNFAEATKTQGIISELENLRPLLPNLKELKDEMSEMQKEMEIAMKKKDFATAGTINGNIESLEEKIKVEEEIEKEFVPKPKPQSPSEKKENELKDSNPILYTAKNNPMKTPLKKINQATIAKTKLNIATSKHEGTSRKDPGIKKGSSRVKENSDKPVSKLRPKKPLISNINDSVLMVSQMLANKRGSASLVIGIDGSLAGILTDTDVTRRLVAKDLDAGRTNVSKVMTANPTVVSMSDSAMDALSTMVENHFRHLPVVDDNGAVVGVLDIAKCLNDAIRKLEKAEDKNSDATEDAVKQMAALQGAGGHQAAMLTQLLGPLMAQAFGNKSSPTLRSLLAGKPATIVTPTTNLRDTAVAMAEDRKAALIVDNGELVGIFGFKDMMSRAVAKELPLEHTPVESVMTPNPEAVSPDMTVIEALQVLHDNKFLNLPVCEDDGRVCGLVGVMDLIYGCGGAEGWRSLFDSTMAMDGDDSYSVTSGSVRTSRTFRSKVTVSKSMSVSPRKSVPKNIGKPVSKLRPKKPVICSSSDSICHVSKLLASKRSAAAILTDCNHDLTGIITDHDIVRRVVARHKDPQSTVTSSVMTAEPAVVSMNDSASEALIMMIERHYRYLPVVDENGDIKGLLDIGKCLNDAITKLEKSVGKNSSSSENEFSKILSTSAGGNTEQAMMLSKLLGPIMEKAFKNKGSATLRDLLANKPATGYSVNPRSSILVAGMKMADNHKAALVVENDRLVGIVAFKDVVTRAIAKEMSLDTAEVSEIMTPDPDCVTPETSVIEAMQIMHDSNFLTLPVCEENGTVCGVVDIMDLIYGAGGAEGWRSIFESALEMDELSAESRSVYSSTSRNSHQRSQVAPLYSEVKADPVIHVGNSQYASAVLNNVPRDVIFNEGEIESMGDSLLDRTLPYPSSSPERTTRAAGELVFKIVDVKGHKYLIRSEASYSSLVKAVSEKIEGKIEEKDIRLKFIDDEGDEINLNSDDCLGEAIESSVRKGNQGVKLILTIIEEEKLVLGLEPKKFAMLGGGVALAIGLGALALLKPRR